MDDKHFCKVGEPVNPITAVDRGRAVLVSEGKKLVVSDHDFAKCSIVPSVTMLIDVPSVATDSFYGGQVFVGLKDHVFEASSPIRHATELRRILFDNQNPVKPVLLLHTDGGPDHRCNFLSVQASLIALFRSLDLDMLIAVRTAPNASWRNPPERVMSLLNLGLNCVGLMRDSMDPNYEFLLKSCNNMKSIRDKAATVPELRDAFSDSLKGVKQLIIDLFSRLSWKEKPLKIFQPASDESMDSLITFLKEIDDSISLDTMNAKDLKGKKKLTEFIEHCSFPSNVFQIRKCGNHHCEICGPPRSEQQVFSNLKWLPDPHPQGDGHYKPFSDVYRTETTEEHRPSLKKKIMTSHGIPFSPSAQTCKTVKRVVVCTECSKPKVLYCEKKLDRQGLIILDRVLELYNYTCGSSLQDLIKPVAVRINAVLEKVFVRKNVSCGCEVEIPYFSSGLFEDVCIKCGLRENLNTTENGVYPSCGKCDNVLKKKRNLHATGGPGRGKKGRI